ncbi:MAG: poly-beta-hydroxybutyrate polymerase N-terminal domain-containing protein, partial [Hyphomicrobiaceae bacterium]
MPEPSQVPATLRCADPRVQDGTRQRRAPAEGSDAILSSDPQIASNSADRPNRPETDQLSSRSRNRNWDCLPEHMLPLSIAGSEDSFAAHLLPEAIDRAHHAALARLTGGLSPAALAEAYFDWMLHLATAPGKQFQLTQKLARKILRLQMYAMHALVGHAEACIEPLDQDRRFNDPEWNVFPWSVMYQGFLLSQQWWHNATTTVPGVSKQHERILEF